MQDAPSLELGHYTGVLRRRWYVVLLGLLIGVGLAAAYLQTAQRSVTATTTARVNLISTEPFNTARPPSDLLDSLTEVQTVTSSAVMESVAADLGTDRTAQQVRANTDASLIPNTTVMRIRYSAPTQTEAEAGANAIATDYLDYRTVLADARISAVVTKLSDRRDDLRDDLVAANTQAANARPGSGVEVQAESDRQLVSIELNGVTTEINQYQGIDTSGGVMLVGAGEAAATIKPSKQLIAGTGVGMGLLLGILAAFAVSGLDRRLRDRFDIRKAGGGEVLSVVPGTAATLPATGKDLDAIRSLRERLLATLPGEAPVLAVADLTRTATDVGPNLAHAFCETGRRVDLVMPGVSPELLASLVAGFGLTDEGETAGVHLYSGGTLDVLIPAEGSLPVARETFVADRLSDDARWTDLTVIALPPGAERSQLLGAARLGHSTILVISRASTSSTRVGELADELSAVGAVVHGTVVVPRGRVVRDAPEGKRVRTAPESSARAEADQPLDDPQASSPSGAHEAPEALLTDESDAHDQDHGVELDEHAPRR